MLDDGRVGGLDAFDQHGMALPFLGEIDRAVDGDVAVGGAFRDHEDVAAMLDEEGVGEMPGLLQHRHDGTGAAGLVEGDDGDDALFGLMVEILEEQIVPALPAERKRIGVEMVDRVGKHIPADAIEIAARPDVAARLDETVADAPVRAVAAELVGSADGSAGDIFCRAPRQCRRG